MNGEFLVKMIKAKQMEMEALSCLIPEPMKVHTETIGREIRSMLTEMVMGGEKGWGSGMSQNQSCNTDYDDKSGQGNKGCSGKNSQDSRMGEKKKHTAKVIIE